MEAQLDKPFEEDNTEENYYQKQIRKTFEVPIKTMEEK